MAYKWTKQSAGEEKKMIGAQKVEVWGSLYDVLGQKEAEIGSSTILLS